MKEIMIKLIKDYIVKLYDEQYKYFIENHSSSSKPESLFIYSDMEEEYVFNGDNWNSGQDIVRHFLLDLYDSRLPNSFDLSFNENRLYGFIQYDEDDWYADIIHTDEKGFKTSYLIRWYKHRGRTGLILRNGYNITLDEYALLILILQKAGFLTITFDNDILLTKDCTCISEDELSNINSIKSIEFTYKPQNNITNVDIEAGLIKIQKNSLYGIHGVLSNNG